jgi:drug/metabolite transporter (DMT)-like permease
MSLLSAIFAIAAALLFAQSASLQQSTARATALDSSTNGALAVLRSLLRQPRWLAGLAANVGGFVAHAAALRYGPLAPVQALLVVQLMFALPLAARRRRISLLPRDWVGTAIVCAGLVVLVTRPLTHGSIRPGALPPWLLGASGAVALLAAAATRVPVRHTQGRAAFYGIAAGVCSATTAVLTAVGVARLPHLSWPVFVIAATTLASGGLAQAAFASGSLPTALTSMTITDPVCSYLATGWLFLSVKHVTPWPLTIAGALVAVGIGILADSPTLHDERDSSGERSDRTDPDQPTSERVA